MSKWKKTYKEAAHDEQMYIRGRMRGEIKSLKTPWKKLNDSGIEGLEWGTVNTIAAMSGVGKTALVNELLFSCHDLNPDQEIAVLFWTIEMSSRRLVSRRISHDLGIPVKDIYTGDEELMDKINNEVIPKYESYDITYVEKMFSPKKIAEITKAFCQNRLDKFCLIAYDHSLLIRRAPGQSERDALIELANEFNMMKKQFPNSMYNIISQLNRGIENPERIKNKTMHYPRKSDIFGSDALYQASDVVMVMHDPSMLNITRYGPRGYPTTGLLFAHLLKVREGKPGLFVIRNEARINRFPELTRTEYTAYGFDKTKSTV